MTDRKVNWGDDEDEGPTVSAAPVAVVEPKQAKGKKAEPEFKPMNEDNTTLPEEETKVFGSRKEVTTYSFCNHAPNFGKVEKVTKVFRLEKRKAQISKSVIARRKWDKFGEAKGQVGPDSASTNVVQEDVFLTLSSTKKLDDGEEGEDAFSKLKKGGVSSVVKCRYCGGDHWSTKCPFKDNLTIQKPDGAEPDKPEGAEEGGLPRPGGGGTPGGVNTEGKYVPVHARAGRAGRGGESMNDRDDSNTVRVTNLSENTREDDLRDLFRGYGPISRCYLATDRETGQARGFAFISFHRREDAQNAIDQVNGHGYDHLILQVDWAEDRKPAEGGK